MSYRFLADLVLVAHLAFILFALLGALLALVWRWAPLAHLPALAWGAYVELTAGVCPLTPLENALRRAGGAAGYPGGFVEHYLVPVIYPHGLCSGAQKSLGGALILVNVLLYGWILAGRLRRPDRRRAERFPSSRGANSREGVVAEGERNGSEEVEG